MGSPPGHLENILKPAVKTSGRRGGGSPPSHSYEVSSEDVGQRERGHLSYYT